MCYEFDWFHERVRIAEELRKRRPSSEPQTQPKQHAADDPVKPTQAEESREKSEPLPA